MVLPSQTSGVDRWSSIGKCKIARFELTALTQERAISVGVKVQLPFKSGHYRC